MQTLLLVPAGKSAGPQRTPVLGCLAVALAVTFVLLIRVGSAAALPPDAFSATAGVPFSGIVGGFDVDGDRNPRNICIYPAVGSVTIAWGDGSSSAGTANEGAPVDGGGGSLTCAIETFSASGGHTYHEAGTYSVTVSWKENGLSDHISSTATVADQPLIPGTVSFASTPDQTVPYSGRVATFTDGNSFAVASDFSATINWGDGSTGTGTVAAAPGGGFQVSGSHTYAQSGSVPVSVSVADIHGAHTTVTGAVSLGPAPPANGSATSISAVEGRPFSASLGSFTDLTPTASATSFTTTVNWGDGTSSTGTVTAGTAGLFHVSGAHAYHRYGTYPVTITVRNSSGSDSMAGAAVVHDAALSGSPVAITALEDVTFAGVVGTFTDANPFATASGYTASIDWGDGHTSGGSVTAIPGGFEIEGAHAFSQIETGTVTVTIGDGGGSTTTIHSPVQVGAPPAPSTRIVLSPATPTGSDGWYRGALHVAAVPNGLGVPVAQTRCALDPASAPPSFDSLPAACLFAGAGAAVGGDGRHKVYAASENAAGEKEAPVASAAFAIDATAPTVRCGAAPTFVTGGSDERVTATVADRTSGPSSSVVSAAARVGFTGRKLARLTGRDNAGNATSVSCRYRVLGRIDSLVGWNYDAPHAAYTVFTSLVASKVPSGSTIRVACNGGGCPFAVRAIHVAGKRRSRTVDLIKPFHSRRLKVRARVQISVAAPNTFGETWILVIRGGRGPASQRACLSPGSFTKRSGDC